MNAPFKIGDKVLVTTDNWFYAPDGRQYRAVWGTVKGIFSDTQTLGIKTNAKSTNWYAMVGSMMIAGCQIHYAVLTQDCNFEPVPNTEKDGNHPSGIYNADQ